MSNKTFEFCSTCNNIHLFILVHYYQFTKYKKKSFSIETLCSNGQGSSPQPTIAENSDTDEQNGAIDGTKTVKKYLQQEENGESDSKKKKQAPLQQLHTSEDELSENHTSENNTTSIKGEQKEHINNKADVQSATKAGMSYLSFYNRHSSIHVWAKVNIQ